MTTYRITIADIQWDDGKGEYDVSRLPRDLPIPYQVEAANEEDAIESVLSDVSETYGSLIYACCTRVEVID